MSMASKEKKSKIGKTFAVIVAIVQTALPALVSLKNGEYALPERLPAGVEIVTDGVLIAEVYGEEQILIGTAILPLPTYGISRQENATVVVYCDHRLDGNHRYSAKIKEQRLWSMER